MRKLLLAASVIVGLLFVSSCELPKAQSVSAQVDTNNGRYQLMQGGYDPTVNGVIVGNSNYKAVFKVDTQTGAVWRYQSDMKGNATWIAIQ